MTVGDDTIAKRYYDAMQRRGRLVTLRRITSVNGQQPHPPILIGPVLDGAIMTGATTISIRATQAVGRILAGDLLKIGALAPIAVASSATARAPGVDPGTVTVPGFTGVTLVSGVPSGASDGAVIVLTWITDTDVWSSVRSFPVRLRSDQIIAGDLNIFIAALGVAEPAPTDLVLINGARHSIINVDPAFERDIVVAWNVQARAI